MKMTFFIYAMILTTLCSGCSENDGPDAPGTPPSHEQSTCGDISATFVDKYYRLPNGLQHVDATSTEWADTVWQNERVYNQIVLNSNSGEISGLSIDVSDLTSPNGEIPSSSVKLYSVGYVIGDQTPAIDSQTTPRTNALVADALLENLPSELSEGNPVSLWISIDTPKNIPAGLYSGTITITANGNPLAECSIKLNVTQHSLPNPENWDFFLDVWQFPYRLPNLIRENGGGNIELFSDAHLDLLRPFYQILANSGQKCITTYIKDGAFNSGETMIKWTKNIDGKWSFDYTDFDKYVEFMMSLGISRQISCFSLGGWNNSIGYTDMANGGEYRTFNLKIGSDDFNEIWNCFLDDFRVHLNGKGWMDKAVLYMDENRNDEMESIVNTIRSNGSDWKIGLSGRYIDAEIERELYNYSTIIGTIPNSTSITYPIFYTSCSQKHPNNYLTPENPSSEMTWMAWHAIAMGFKGYQRWAFDNWNRSDPFDACDKLNTAGDFHMIYRSGNTATARPISSIRWEMLRDGIQDYEKCRLLDYKNIRSIIDGFKNHDNPDTESLVRSAQKELKKLSIK